VGRRSSSSTIDNQFFWSMKKNLTTLMAVLSAITITFTGCGLFTSSVKNPDGTVTKIVDCPAIAGVARTVAGSAASLTLIKSPSSRGDLALAATVLSDLSNSATLNRSTIIAALQAKGVSQTSTLVVDAALTGYDLALKRYASDAIGKVPCLAESLKSASSGIASAVAGAPAAPTRASDSDLVNQALNKHGFNRRR